MLSRSLLSPRAPSALATSVQGAPLRSAGSAPHAVQVRNMGGNPNELKARVKATQNIRKITKSMKMVSASKLRGDQARFERGIVFGRAPLSVIAPEPARSVEETIPPTQAKKSLILVISSDKGLCGGINTLAAKTGRVILADAQKVQGADAPALAIIGNKAEGNLRRQLGKQIKLSIDENWKSPMNFATASGMASEILAAARAGSHDEIAVVFSSFKSLIKYETKVLRIPNVELKMAEAEDVPEPLNKFELEPVPETETIKNFYEFAFGAALFGTCIDNAVSEQSARMTAMDGATKNAGTMIEKLTLQYNRVRQARITTEITEIVSGSEALSQ